MSKGLSSAHSVVEPTSGTRWFAGFVVVLYALVTIIPLVWIVLTSIKSPTDSISYPPKILFEPSPQGFLQPLHHPFAANARVHRRTA